NIQFSQPSVERFAQFDLSAVGFQGLTLEIEANQARAGTVGNANAHGFTGEGRPQSRLNDKRDMISVDLPTSVIGKFLVGQGALCPPTIQKANFAFFGAHIAGGCLYDPTIYVERQYSRLPVLF